MLLVHLNNISLPTDNMWYDTWNKVNLGCSGHALRLGSLLCQFLSYPLSLLISLVRHFGPGGYEKNGIQFSYKERVQIISLKLNSFSYLSSFLLIFSSAFSFWAEVRLSASARLSTAMAKKTLRRISDVWAQENRKTLSQQLLNGLSCNIVLMRWCNLVIPWLLFSNIIVHMLTLAFNEKHSFTDSSSCSFLDSIVSLCEGYSFHRQRGWQSRWQPGCQEWQALHRP